MNSEQFRKIRAELRMTQTELAAALGLSRRAIQAYEDLRRTEPIPTSVAIAVSTFRPKRKSKAVA